MRLRNAILATVAALWVGGAGTALAAPINTYELIAPGPLDGVNIVLRLENNDTFPILFAEFDTSATQALAGGVPLIFDGIVGPEINGTGGAATFGLLSETAWRYDFGSFAQGDFFQFAWDPDIAGSPAYGATVAEQLGLIVRIGTSAGILSGSLVADPATGQIPGLHVVIPSPDGTPAPEPGTLLLLGGGLLGLMLRRERR